DGRGLLADRDVDALDAGTALVDDRVDRNGGLARLAVADDQLALAAADRHHRVDGLEPGLHRLVDGFSRDDAGRDFLDRRRLRGFDRALAVDRLAQGIHDAAEQRFADRHFENAARRLDGVAFGDVLVVSEHDRADRILLEVQRQSERVLGELEHFAVACVGEPVNAHDAVGHADDGADVPRFRGRFEILDALFDQLADFGSFECHVLFLDLCGQRSRQALQPRAQRTIDYYIAGADHGAADQGFVQLRLEAHVAAEALPERLRDLLLLRLVQPGRGRNGDVDR